MKSWASVRPVRAAAVLGALCTAPLAQSGPASAPPSSTDSRQVRALDAIPPALFRKMLTSHRLVGSPGLAWKKQRVITVAFNGGSDDLYQLIEHTANEWPALGGQLSFSFKGADGHYRHWTTDDKVRKADIRIAFGAGGYWALIGALAQNADLNDVTMNFEGFPDDLQRYFMGQHADEWLLSYEHETILHEFGHALGLSHEHFHPQCQRDLKLPEIITFLEGPPNNWSEEQAKFNMDAKFYFDQLGALAGPLDSTPVMTADIDRSSVMLYDFDSSYYQSGKQSPCLPIGDHGKTWPTTLSAGDKAFYLANYKTIASPFGAALPRRSSQ